MYVDFLFAVNQSNAHNQSIAPLSIHVLTNIPFRVLFVNPKPQFFFRIHSGAFPGELPIKID